LKNFFLFFTILPGLLSAQYIERKHILVGVGASAFSYVADDIRFRSLPQHSGYDYLRVHNTANFLSGGGGQVSVWLGLTERISVGADFRLCAATGNFVYPEGEAQPLSNSRASLQFITPLGKVSYRIYKNNFTDLVVSAGGIMSLGEVNITDENSYALSYDNATSSYVTYDPSSSQPPDTLVPAFSSYHFSSLGKTIELGVAAYFRIYKSLGAYTSLSYNRHKYVWGNYHVNNVPQDQIPQNMTPTRFRGFELKGGICWKFAVQVKKAEM
jgi:hypothetical protein